MDSTDISAQPETAISLILENISKQLAERDTSRSLQIFSATVSYCKSLIINELVWEGKEIAAYEDKLGLEKRISDLRLQLNVEEQLIQVALTKRQAEVTAERERMLKDHEFTMEELKSSLRDLQADFDMRLTFREEKEHGLHSLLKQINNDIHALAHRHAEAIQEEEKEISELLKKLQDDESTLLKLKQHYIMVDRNIKAKQEEEDALQKVKAMEDAANLILSKAATNVQRVSRGKKSRNETAKIKAKSRKGKKKRKEKQK
jgi:hypothetical protein